MAFLTHPNCQHYALLFSCYQATGYRDSSSLEDSGRSGRGLRFGSQHPHSSLQPSITPVPAA